MAGYEKISTGVTGLDEAINYLRAGDNVVWQVDSVEDFESFATPFVKTSLEQGRRLVYIRFARHKELIPETEGIKRYTLEASQGFETFTVQVHGIIEKEGAGVYYVFDCLSDLLHAWATDLMTGNFFRVTCPYLYILDTIAYFPILRNRHSFETIARIRETTQLLLDLYNIDGRRYIHPLKVWNRYSPTMFLPHIQKGDKLSPITSSAEASALFTNLPQRGIQGANRMLDYWDRLFLQAEEMAYDEDTDIETKRAGMLDKLCRLIIAREGKILELVKGYFTLEDILKIKTRLIGTGYIGGKAVGMLLARKILSRDPEVDWNLRLEPHDSYHIGSDVFYTYIVQNGWWQLLMEQRKKDGYFEKAAELKKNMKSGIFPDAIKEQFMQMLEYFGQSPILVRSSSLLEDGFGNAFAGKYESVFCVNQGTPAQRYLQFEEAVRTVYASTMNKEALEYRLKRQLDQQEEQMALLVQRVSGDYHTKYFFPILGGVGFSYNLYIWRQGMDAKAGMLRIVFGLGTRAVGRGDGDYPRMMALGCPNVQPFEDAEDMKAYSQHMVDVLNIEKNELQTIPLNQLMAEGTGVDMNLLAEYDHETNARIKEYGIEGQEAWNLKYERLIKDTDFIALMRRMLGVLESAYKHPVDVEFTVNFTEGDEPHINLVQCRPLQVQGEMRQEGIPTGIDPGQILFESRGHFMGMTLQRPIKRVIYVHPEAYGRLSEAGKYDVARIIGEINQMTDRESMPALLIGPGRWGTSTASLGVPVSYSEIGNASVLCEVACKVTSLIPDLSYGSHFFLDLVESDILYVALFPDTGETVYNTGYFENGENRLVKLMPERGNYSDVIKVLDVEACISAELETQRIVCYKIGN